VKLGIPKKDSMCIVGSLFDIIKGELEKGNDVMISGFGKWSVKAKRERNGRNPQTDEALLLDARKVVKFHPALVLNNVV
jgi:integration host factor subunit alpha